jgi:hypothetical protein
MRSHFGGRLLLAIFALAAFALVADSVWAATKTLAGKYNVGQIDIACINAQGIVTSGTGPGGFGCKTSKGEVSCTKSGKCTGTCQNCAPRTAPKGHDLDFVLHDGTISTSKQSVTR